MKPDKVIKAEFREIASREPEKHYPVSVLKKEGFARNKCSHCGKFFWSVHADANVCGDPACSGGYRFVGNSPARKQFDYLGAWKGFRDFFKKKGYFEYKTYPVVARWRPDVYWVGASVYPFQPYVVSGEIKPKSNAAIIPQLCLRFNDIDNVGITGSHYVCFDMFGQLHFEQAKNYKMSDYWLEYFEWLTKGMGVPADELVVHEDAWAGGGTFGPCMEFFSRGMEIGNQVYMQYRQTETGFEELSIKVLDMGQGHERVPWFTTGKSTSYETTFPTVARHLYSKSGIKVDEKFMQKFLPYSALLNFDETDDIEKVWAFIAQKLSMSVSELKEKVLPLSEVYSVGEHSRAALVALSDGALPSNVGGGYNLRTVMRRAMSFIEKNAWDIDFFELCKMHAAFLKPMYPHLNENLEDIKRIVENEEKKFHESRERTGSILSKSVLGEVSTQKLLELYDSHGISPHEVAKEAKKIGKVISVPQNFFSLVSERHEQAEQVTATRKESKLDISGIPETKILYYGDWKLVEFSARVVKVLGDLVALDQTAFYPTSGGQIFDTGELSGARVVEVFKQGGVVLHKVVGGNFREGQSVQGKIDFERRKQLMQHHSGVHVLNFCARKVLGPHVYQAGAAKTLDKGRLDITHFDQLTEKELGEIQACADKVVAKNLPVKKEFLPREVAEEKYGMGIYQGGFIPGKNLRIVTIAQDVEACGGTHANSTGEIGAIKIVGSTKIQDGVIRLFLVSGSAREKIEQESVGVLLDVQKLLGVDKNLVLSRTEELFQKWKKAKKSGGKSGGFSKEDFVLLSARKDNLPDEEILSRLCALLSTQKEHLPKTITRFLTELATMAENQKKASK